MDSPTGFSVTEPPGTVEAGLEDRGVPEEEGGGGMSVLSTLVAFRFGFGAVSRQRKSNFNGLPF